MPAKKITREAALTGLMAAIEVKGADYVSPEPPAYFNEKSGSPQCLVGHALADAEVTAQDLEEVVGPDYNSETVWAIYGVTRPYTRAAVYFEQDAAKLLHDAQILQDRGTPWGEAVERALNNEE